jgi:DNA-binding SARP family transcriptional activator
MRSSRGLPFFICAPRKTGRTALALSYSQRFHHLDEVLWIDASTDTFVQALGTNTMLEHLETQIMEGLSTSKLVVIDDLPFLEPQLAQRLSVWMDQMIAQHVELIVITTPQDDCMADFQSDRLLINGAALVASQGWQKARRNEALDCFFDAPIPRELITLSALMLLMGRGIVDNLRELDYQIPAGLHVALKEFCPFYEIDEGSGYFDTSCFSLKDFAHVLPVLLNEAPRKGESEDMPDLERSFERLTQLSLHLFGRGEREQGMLLLELVGTLLSPDEDEVLAIPSIDNMDVKVLQEPKPVENIEDPQEATSPREPIEPLVVRLFGDFEIIKGGRRVEGRELGRKKVRELLVHLVLNTGRGVSRDTLMERIWSDKDYAHAKDNFYATWSRLSRTIASDSQENPYITNRAGLCKIETDTVFTDILEFEQLAKYVLFEHGTIEQQVEAIYRVEKLYRGDILAACKLDPYLLAAQQRYRAMMVDVMLAASKLFSSQGNDTNAVWFARKAHDADSTREDVYRILMTMQDRAGQRTSALRTYFDCKRFLSDDLGILPSQKTTALYQELILDRR